MMEAEAISHFTACLGRPWFFFFLCLSGYLAKEFHDTAKLK